MASTNSSGAQAPTGSDRVVVVLQALGGTATRMAVLDAVAAVIGVRESISAVRLAEIFGRVERVLLADGRVGLRLVEAADR